MFKGFGLLLASLLYCPMMVAQFSYKVLEDNKPEYYRARAEYPEFEETTSLARFANTQIRTWIRGDLDRYSDDLSASMKEYLEAQKLERPPAPWTYDTKCDVTYFWADQLISIRCAISEYLGGSEADSYFQTFNFGIRKGHEKLFVIEDLFPSESNIRQIISGAITEKVEIFQGRVAGTSSEGVVFQLGHLDDEQIHRFVVEPDGLLFLFNRCEIGPCSSGPVAVRLSFQEMMELGDGK